MIPRSDRAISLAITLLTAGLLTVACDRVPLLAPSGSTITLTAAANTLPLNGTTQLIAQVLEAGGTPPQDGTLVTFITTLGSVNPPEAETHGGKVVVVFNAGSQNGTAVITASSGGASASGLGAVRVAIGAAAVGRMIVDANPGTVSANGGTSTITSTVFDVNGNPLPAVQVSFSTDAGSISPSIVSADGNGRAQSILTTNRTARVTASAGNLGSGGSTGSTGGTGATGATGPTSSAQSASVTVTVNSPAGLTIGTPSPATPTAGQTVTFPLTFNTTNATPISRITVDWGDGSSPQTFNGQPSAISHLYRNAGSFVVVVTGVDSFGDSVSATASVTVAPAPRPTVTIAASANPTVNTTTVFTLTITPPTGATITSVTVDYGDGTRDTLNGNVGSVQHVYTTAGTFQVTATATDSNGQTGSGATVIVVAGSGSGGSGAAPTASFTVTPATLTGTTATIFSFDASASTASSTIVEYRWNFGDGSAQLTGATTSHQYSAPTGSKTVTLTVTDSLGRTGTATKTLTIS
jgi:PKD repeat protein